MGQSSSKKRKTSKNDSARLTKNKRDYQVLELFNNNNVKNNIVRFDDNTSNDDSSFSLSGDLNKEKLLGRVNSKNKVKEGHKCKYEVIKAISTSAKLCNKNNTKRNYNLSIQTFRGDAVEYLVDVPYSDSSSVIIETDKNINNVVKDTNTHSKINVKTLFSIDTNTFVPYNVNHTITKSTQVKNRPCLELPPYDGSQQIKDKPQTVQNEGKTMSQQVKPRPLLELPLDNVSRDTLNLNQVDEPIHIGSNKNIRNISTCSFCGYFLGNNKNTQTHRARNSLKDSNKQKKTYFYRCPVCQHLIESKSKDQKKSNQNKVVKLSSLMLIDSDFSCKLKKNTFSDNPTSTNKCRDEIRNVTEYFQTLQGFYINESVKSPLAISKSFIEDGAKPGTKNVKEKSAICALTYSKNKIEEIVSHDSVKLAPASSVLLVPPSTHKKASNMKWESILPKLISMPANKVLYVVEVNRSDQKTPDKLEKKPHISNRQLGKLEGFHSQPIKHKCVQTPYQFYGFDYKNADEEGASLKIVQILENRHKVKLKTLNQFLLEPPKYLISLLMNGRISKQKIDYKPIKIPFDCNKFIMFMSSGV